MLNLRESSFQVVMNLWSNQKTWKYNIIKLHRLNITPWLFLLLYSLLHIKHRCRCCKNASWQFGAISAKCQWLCIVRSEDQSYKRSWHATSGIKQIFSNYTSRYDLSDIHQVIQQWIWQSLRYIWNTDVCSGQLAIASQFGIGCLILAQKLRSPFFIWTYRMT